MKPERGEITQPYLMTCRFQRTMRSAYYQTYPPCPGALVAAWARPAHAATRSIGIQAVTSGGPSAHDLAVILPSCNTHHILFCDFSQFLHCHLRRSGSVCACRKFIPLPTMSKHNSLKSSTTVGGKRSVLKRFERVKLLKERGEWVDGRSPVGLPKTKHQG